MGVLRLLNIARTQLHPNSWVFMQAFRIVCKFLLLTPTPEVFLGLNLLLKVLMLNLKRRARKRIEVVDGLTHHQGVIVMVPVDHLYLFQRVFSVPPRGFTNLLTSI